MLVFVHIPKTAGTTLHKVITHQYPPGRILIRHDTDGPLAEAIPEGSADLPAVVMGHLSVGLHRYHPGARYITCLRDPVARLVSHYHHALNDPAHYLHEAIRRDNLDLGAYVGSGLSGELSNGMTRMLAGVEDFHHAAVGPETLALAKRHIEEHFDGVILSERFDEGLLLLAKDLGWKTPYYLRRKVGRYASSAAKPDAAIRQTIAEHNALDIGLYEWAKARFGQMADASPSLAQAKSRFQARNRRWGKAVFLAREAGRRLKFKDSHK